MSTLISRIAIFGGFDVFDLRNANLPRNAASMRIQLSRLNFSSRLIDHQARESDLFQFPTPWERNSGGVRVRGLKI